MKVTKKVSVKELLDKGKLKEGDKLKLKYKGDCEDKYPGLIREMDRYFGTTVTIETFFNGNIRIKETGGWYSWHVDWFCDVETEEEIILDFKEALERSMYVWEYMIDNDCNKVEANKALYNVSRMYGDCFLCDSLGGYRSKGTMNEIRPNCIKCVNWSKKNPINKIDQICLNDNSPYQDYHLNRNIKESKQNILNFLKKEYIRLHGLKLLKENSPKLYRFLVKKDILDKYWDNFLKRGVQSIIESLKLNKTLMNSFTWWSSNEGSKYWVDLDDEFGKKLIKFVDKGVEKDGEKEYYVFSDTDVDFNQVCNDALEDKKVSFIIKGKEKAYVGLLNSGKKVGVPIMIGDFFQTNGLDSVNYITDLPYGIFEISLDKVDSWKDKLKDYSVNYEKWKNDLNTSIKDRGRDKGKNRFKVYQY